jgi:hypothetical protein
MHSTTIAISDYQFHKALLDAYFRGMPPPLGVDLAPNSVYAAARNLVFGLILLTRSRLWAALQVNSQKLGKLPSSRCAGVQPEA